MREGQKKFVRIFQNAHKTKLCIAISMQSLVGAKAERFLDTVAESDAPKTIWLPITKPLEKQKIILRKIVFGKNHYEKKLL